MARRLRPNEIPEMISDYKGRRPKHTAAEWIEEAIYASGQHCEDHDIEVCTFLYCALNALKEKNQKSKCEMGDLKRALRGLPATQAQNVISALSAVGPAVIARPRPAKKLVPAPLRTAR